MLRIKEMFAGSITSLMPGNHLTSDHNFDVVYVGLHGCRLEGKRTWHAVAIVVKGNGLVLVNLARVADAIIESAIGQRDRGGALLLKASTNRFALPRGNTLEVLLATFAQVSVQFSDVSHLRDGRGPTSLQILDPILDVRLLVTASWHTEQWIEVVMARQGLITRMQRPLPPRQDCGSHGGWIVPPQLSWYRAEKLEGLNHSVQDRLDPFGR